MGKQPKPGQSNQLVLSAILAPLVSLVVIRQITPFSMSKFQAAKVSETGTLSPSCNDVLPVSCNIPRRNCSHHSETYMFLLNYMDNQLFFSSTASHWEKPWSDCKIRILPTFSSFTMPLGRSPHLSGTWRWQSWAQLLAANSSFWKGNPEECLMLLPG